MVVKHWQQQEGKYNWGRDEAMRCSKQSDLSDTDEENLSAMYTSLRFSGTLAAYHQSHPPLVERVAAIDEPDEASSSSC